MTKRKIYIFGIMLLFVITISISGVVLAKYFKENKTNVGITSKKFYFTVDLLGDTVSDEMLKKSYTLAGGDDKEITFNVQNFFDEYRICDTEVTYTISMTIDSTNSSYDTSNITLTTSDPVSSEYKLNKDVKDFDKWNLTIPTGYKDNTKIKIVIKSSSPYIKEMQLEFICTTYENEYSYEMIDEADSPIARLIIKTNVDIEIGDLTIDFSSINTTNNMLQIDVTDEYVVDIIDGLPVLETNKLKPGETYFKSVVNTIKINAGESIEIIFYKTDKTKDYSFSIVSLDSVGGKFLVTID